MTTFFMDYNPYTTSYIFKKNGRAINQNSRLAGKSGQRLQALLKPTDDNWEGIDKEIQKVCNDSKIKLVFRGRRIDYEDLGTVLQESTAAKYSMELQETSNDNDVIGQLDQLFDEIRGSNIPEFAEKNRDGKSIYEAYEEVKNNVFNINVIATMSSGKSTLINALLGTELLPTENQACTATIARILDNDNMAGKGYNAVCYGKDGKTVVHPSKTVSAEDLKLYNKDENVTYIDLEGEIPAIPSDKIRLCLCDTPGPNNSRNENHGRLTNSIIRETNAMVLYVMNATNLGVKDDEILLQSISEEMKKNGKVSRDRFIFVVNKCDMLDEEKGETVESTLCNVRDYLKGFGIVDPVIVPTSARLALVIRKARNQETLSRQERNVLQTTDDFVQYDLLHLEKFASLTPSADRRLRKDIEKYHSDEETWDLEAVIHSGIGALEELIKEYLEKYAYPIKINDAIQDIKSILDDIDMRTSFDRRIAADEKERDNVLRQIEVEQEKQKKSSLIVDQYCEQIRDFEINQKEEDDRIFGVENHLFKMLNEYDGMIEVDKSEADQMIDTFIEKLKSYEQDCENALVHFLDVEVYDTGTRMLNDYKSTVAEILHNIHISGYDFSKDRSFSRIQISNLEDIKRKNETDRMREETRWKPNPKREGFFGFFRFRQPKKIPYIVEVKDGVNVNILNVMVDIMTPFKGELQANIKSMYKQAEKQLAGYKENFMENMTALNKEIDRILDRLKAEMSNYEKLREKVEWEKGKAAFAEAKMMQLENVIKF